jgi:hypothetical protein
VVVGEHRCRADEYAVLEHRGLVDQRVVLELAVVAHQHAGPHIGAAADDAVLPEHRALTNLREVPHR